MKPRLLPALVGLMILVMGASQVLAEAIDVRAGRHADYGRMVFNWSLPVPYTANIEGRELVLTFGEPAETSYAAVRRTLSRYVTSISPSSDNRTVRMQLTGDYGLRHFYTGASLVVDILELAPQSSQPQASQAPAANTASEATPSGPSIRVRKGEHPTYTRIVMDWDRRVPYTVERTGDTVSVRFQEPASFNTSAATRSLRGQVRSVTDNPQGGAAALDIGVVPGADINHFYAGNKVVVDVQRPDPNRPVTAQAPAQPAAPAPVAPAPAAETQPAPVQQAENAPPAPPVTRPAATDEPPAPPAVPAAPVTAPAALSPPGGAQVAAAPEPSAVPVLPDVPQGSTAFTLTFEWTEPVAAASFRRGNAVWIVFDKASTPDIEAFRDLAGDSASLIESIPVPRSTVIRAIVPPELNPSPRREGLTWLFEFRRQPQNALNEINLDPQPFSPAGARLFMPVGEAGFAIPIRDPGVGDNIIAVPVIPLSYGVNESRSFPQFRVLPSSQGVVYKPLTDDVRVRTLGQGIEVTSAAGLKLSALERQEQAAAQSGGQLKGISRVFDLDSWSEGGLRNFMDSRVEIQNELAAAQGPRKDIAREKMARFYFANGLTAEALGVLRVIEADDPDKANSIEHKLMRGASNLWLNRVEEAAVDLSDEEVLTKDEGQFWNALLRARQGDIEGAAVDLKRLAAILRPYPAVLKVPLGALLTEAALSIGDIRQAESYIEVLEAEGLTAKQGDWVQYLKGRMRELSGENDAALQFYETAEMGRHLPSRAQAILAKNELLRREDQITDQDLIEAMEKLRYAWRGDDFEVDLLQRLGTLYMDNADYRNGLRTLRQLVTYFRTHPKAPDVTQQMITAFEKLYLDGEADKLPPVTAIALYDEFRELTPSGEKGDEMIRKLADRLASVDLLPRAASLLENQVQFRLAGEQRAQVGARLAVIYLTNNQPTEAIAALDKSRSSGLPTELQNQRKYLRAQALVELERPADALALLEDDEAEPADMLRSQIHWAGQEWGQSSIALRRILRHKGGRSNQPLDDAQAGTVLRLGVSMLLGNNERGLASLAADYGPAMEASPYRDAFRLITSRDGVMDPRTAARLVRPAEAFLSFMQDYEQSLKAGELSMIN